MTLLLPSLPALPHLALSSSICPLGEPQPGGAHGLRSLLLTTAMLSLPMAHSLTWQEFPFSSCPWMPRPCCTIQCAHSQPLCFQPAPPPPPLSNSDSVLSSLRTCVLPRAEGLLAAHSLCRASSLVTPVFNLPFHLVSFLSPSLSPLSSSAYVPLHITPGSLQTRWLFASPLL